MIYLEPITNKIGDNPHINEKFTQPASQATNKKAERLICT
ncbi:hypothetical protein GAPWKB30_0546 [Gilliamella apicola]|nr:hypothetical protein GAPWKB30_0546 [Gilliamella apicola]